MTRFQHPDKASRGPSPTAAYRNSAKKLAAPLCACALSMLGSGCAGLSLVSGLMTGPLPRQAPEQSAPPPSGAAAAGTGKFLYGLSVNGQCMRDWTRPECQHGNSAETVYPAANATATGGRIPAAPTGNGKHMYGLGVNGQCMRDWTSPECQHGNTAAPADGDLQPAPNPAESSNKPSAGPGAFIAVLAIVAIAIALAHVLTAAAMAGLP